MFELASVENKLTFRVSYNDHVLQFGKIAKTCRRNTCFQEIFWQARSKFKNGN